MDVTFFENQPYYPKTIQGDNLTQEYQFWNLELFGESLITTKNPILKESENHISPKSLNQPIPTKNIEFIIDLRDKKHIQEKLKETNP